MRDSRLLRRWTSTTAALATVAAACLLLTCSDDPDSQVSTHDSARDEPASTKERGDSGIPQQSTMTPTVVRLQHDGGIVNIDGGRQPISAEFTIANDGAEPTSIVAIKPSCSCVSHGVDQTEIDAGASATLSLEFSIESPGYVEHSATCVLANGQIFRCVINAIGEMTSRVSLATDAFEATPGGELPLTVVSVRPSAPHTTLDPDLGHDLSS